MGDLGVYITPQRACHRCLIYLGDLGMYIKPQRTCHRCLCYLGDLIVLDIIGAGCVCVSNFQSDYDLLLHLI